MEHVKRRSTSERMAKQTERLRQLRVDLVAAESEGDYESADEIRSSIRKATREYTLVK